MPEAVPEPGRHLEHLLATRPPRAKSLVVTVFGDSILPHGGTVWVGSLIRLLGPFGINERGVRTAVQRLTVEGWLSNRSVGRRSDYTPTAESRPRFEEADRRIYAAAAPDWDGTWCLVLLGQAGISTSEREVARRELRWLGFGDEDLADAGSDRLVDAIVAWGDEKAIAERIQAHRDAGADHVCIQPLRADGAPGPDLRILEALAPAKN